MELVGLAGACVGLAISAEPVAPAAALAWAAFAGAVGVGGLAALYRALAEGMMSLVSPLAAAIAAGLPAIVGVLFLQEFLSLAQTAGVTCAVVAVGIVSFPAGSVRLSRLQLILAFAAGIGFGLFFVAVDQAEEAGAGVWWLLAVVRLVSTALVGAVLVALVLARRSVAALPAGRLLGLLVATGIGDLGGNLFTTLALPLASLGIVAVVSSLYPIVTVFLAVGLLGERLARAQVVGVSLAIAAIPLIAA